MTGRSLRIRLGLAGAAAIAVALGLAALGLASLFGAHVERRAEAELSAQLDQVLGGLARDAAGALAVEMPPADPRFQRPLSGLYWQISTDEGLLRSRSLWDQTLPEAEPPPPGTARSGLRPGPGGAELLVLDRRVTLPARLGGAEAVVSVALDRAELLAARADFLRDLLAYLALLGAALALAGWVQISVGLRPLAAVGRQVEAVRAGRQTRLGTGFPREVLPLAAELDALIAAREADVERARGRAADLAHGLKTPLQALLGEAARLRERGEAGPAAAIEDIALAMRRHVDRELARARLATRRAALRADPAEVAGRVVAVLRRTPQGAALDWDLRVPHGLFAAIDPDDLTEALGALAENAARHARTRVALTGARVEAGVEIALADDGPGIPPERIVALMARGARDDERGAGTGLGLAIAAEIVEAAGGSLTLGGEGGLTVRVLLPAAPFSENPRG